MFRTRRISLVSSLLLVTQVGGEFDRVLEVSSDYEDVGCCATSCHGHDDDDDYRDHQVEMYGSRPGNVDSLVVPSRDYYKYEELSESGAEEEARGETQEAQENQEAAPGGVWTVITISVSDGLSAFQDITRKSRGDTETGRWEVASLCLVLLLSLM